MAANSELRARDVMSSPVKTIDADVSLREAAAFLSDNKISGAVVLGDRGKPVGVVSLFDIAAHLAGLDRSAESPGGFYAQSAASFESDDENEETSEEGRPLDETVVLEIMTPEIISVEPDASMREVATRLWKRRIHRVFVCEKRRVLGVVSSLDVLRAQVGLVGARKAPARPRAKVGAGRRKR